MTCFMDAIIEPYATYASSVDHHDNRTDNKKPIQNGIGFISYPYEYNDQRVSLVSAIQEKFS